MIMPVMLLFILLVFLSVLLLLVITSPALVIIISWPFQLQCAACAGDRREEGTSGHLFSVSAARAARHRTCRSRFSGACTRDLGQMSSPSLWLSARNSC